MPIGIMSAMSQEIDGLLCIAQGGDPQCVRLGDREFFRTTLKGKDVVLAFSRWGKVAAAITSVQLIDHFKVDSLWFAGVAGAIDPSLRIGDIVIARGLVQHDLDASPLFPRFEIPLTGRARLETDEGQTAILRRAADEFLATQLSAEIPQNVRRSFGIDAPKVVEADIATGDRFITRAEDVAALRKSLPACACVEMEGAAVAQACVENHVPCAVLRVISDSADGNAHIDFVRFIDEVASTYTHAIISNALAGAAR